LTLPAGASAIAIRDGSLRLRPADADDEAFLERLFKSTRAEQFAAANLPAAVIDAVLGQQYRAQTAGYAARFPSAESLIIEHLGTRAGRLLLHAVAPRWHIVDIALLTEARRQGIGSAIIEALARTALTAGAQELTLAVLASNAAARRFYARLGFTETSVNASHLQLVRRLDGEGPSR
jgi:ribosomal protein S18 acetylase RimI-like enzyme